MVKVVHLKWPVCSNSSLIVDVCISYIFMYFVFYWSWSLLGGKRCLIRLSGEKKKKKKG